MSKPILVPLLAVTIRRDAHTITQTTVPAYEMTLLRQMFGKENVTEGEAVGELEVVPTGEHERLCAKYGSDKIAKVYGDDEGERLAELVEKAATKAKTTKSAKADSGNDEAK